MESTQLFIRTRMEHTVPDDGCCVGHDLAPAKNARSCSGVMAVCRAVVPEFLVVDYLFPVS